MKTCGHILSEMAGSIFPECRELRYINSNLNIYIKSIILNTVLLMTRGSMLVNNRVDIEILGNERRNALLVTFLSVIDNFS